MRRIILCILLALTVVSCSRLVQAERDTSARALLDYENGEIVYPLDSYGQSMEDLRFEIAYSAYLYAECMKPHGYTMPGASSLQHIPHAVQFDKIYGQWNVEKAQKTGLVERDKPTSSRLETTADFERIMDETCIPQVRDQLNSEEDYQVSENAQKLTQEIRNQAYHNASSHPEWKQARSEWWSCLESKGLHPRKGEHEWGAQEEFNFVSAPELTEAEIELAVTMAQCSQDTRMAQRLGDLEASYQMPLIRQHQHELNEAKDAIKKRSERIKKIVLTHQ